MTHPDGYGAAATTRQSMRVVHPSPPALPWPGLPNLKPPFWVIGADGHGARWKIVTGMTDLAVAAALRAAADALEGITRREGAE